MGLLRMVILEHPLIISGIAVLAALARFRDTSSWFSLMAHFGWRIHPGRQLKDLLRLIALWHLLLRAQH